MLKRKVMAILERWRGHEQKKTCLLLNGVRQCGKTFIVREFGKKYYSNFIEINFVRSPGLMDAFQGELDVETMVQGIGLKMPGTRFVPGETLLFLDEIQECPNARTSLKFWAEDKRYDVIASGSMLGIRYKEIVSIPVGYETRVRMYPLDFEEFLWARGIDTGMLDWLGRYLTGEEKIPDGTHQSLLAYYREYLAVGGMPDVINAFLQTKDYAQVHAEQERILMDYQDDIAKYAPAADRIKARSCYQSIPRQLVKENHKFQYTLLEKKATARKFQSSLDWLEQAGMVCPACNLSTPSFPLNAYVKEEQFRIYLSDIGLLNCMYGYQMKTAILSDTLEGPSKGAVYESGVADVFAKRSLPLYYYKKEVSTLEIEFLLERDAQVIPVEVKAKKGSSRSLNELLRRPDIRRGYKLTGQNTGAADGKITLPYYLAQIL